MLFDIHLDAGEDAWETGHSLGAKRGNFAAVVRRLLLAGPFPLAVPRVSRPLLVPAGADNNALQ